MDMGESTRSAKWTITFERFELTQACPEPFVSEWLRRTVARTPDEPADVPTSRASAWGCLTKVGE